ncbi:transcription termination factor NusA [Candidatus Kaiserbacteria bacterium RIFCSPHIGHO2_01_FULL_46_22]|uniref:Transcription termination/antitermination protein NusA n=1 Tax=Candidatus Kaiserbacteria bacterium RIFCSPHIGHO2_01_FULL_46_22 TaxID=1798475 RepID=A0A1F6BY26_9BACT|nr:MAG: transcription termination factor NusA [Candidatus Kaiserbacteria bacterium RIFCSPHIGHO2_01_FULL_46_22]
MFDLKVINAVLAEMEEERGIPRQKMLEAIEQALATAYKKEFGKRGQIVRAVFDIGSGTTSFEQVKLVVDESMLKAETDEDDEEEAQEDTLQITADKKVRFDPEKHIMIDNARLIKKDVTVGGEMIFPLEPKDDFGRIAAQTAKQVIIQKVREAEKDAALSEFGQKEGDIVMGHVQRFERGNLYVDLGRITAVMPYEEQIPGERFRPGERVRALLLEVDETSRGVFLKLSRSHPDFLAALFAIEAPELQSGAVEVKAVAREAGSRSKIAVMARDQHLDPVGSLVGQRGVRVSTVMSELGGEKIDIIEWSSLPISFIEDALSPARVLSVKIDQEPNDETGEHGRATVEVAPDQQSLAIGRGGQNVRLAAKLTGWKLDIISTKGEELAEADAENTAPESATVAETEEETETSVAIDDTVEAVETEADEPTTDRDAIASDEEGEIDTPEEAEKELG